MGNKKILAAAMITSFMTTFMSSALNLSVPALESYFHVSAVTVSWVVSAYTITIAAMSLPFGKIADITSRRKVFITGISGFGIISLLCIFSRHISFIIGMRALMGCCAAMIFATNNAILISSYPPDMRGKVIGYSTAATYTGLTAGPVVGGVLNSTLGWRSVFAVSALVSAAALTTVLRSGQNSDHSRSMQDIHHLRSGQTDNMRGSDHGAALSDRVISEGDARRLGSFDSGGTVLYIFAIGSSLYGMTNLDAGLHSVILLIAGIIAVVLFFMIESRKDDPVMKVSMFRESRTFTFSNLAALLNYGATFAISYTVSIYLQVIMGIDSGRAGLLLITMPAVQAIFSPLMGSLSDRIRPSVLASTGMGMCTLTLLMFSRIHEGTSLVYMIGTLALTGLGFALFSSPNTNAILSCVKSEDYGVANSIVATMRTYGQSMGMAILSVITSAVLGSGSLETSPAADILRMMHTAFLVFAVLSLIGLLFSMSRNDKKTAES